MRRTKRRNCCERIEIRREYAKQYVLSEAQCRYKGSAPAGWRAATAMAAERCRRLNSPARIPGRHCPFWVTEQQIGKRVECVAIDEGQFVQDLFVFTKRLLDAGHDVMVSGLELDFRGHAVWRDAQPVVARCGNMPATLRNWWRYCSCGARAFIRSGWWMANPLRMTAR